MKPMRAVGKFILRKVWGDVGWIEYLLKSGRVHKNVYYDMLTDRVMKKALKADSVCVDAGCHEGGILRLMMKYSPKGTFVAFEPIPHLYEGLIRDFKADNVYLYNFVLSNVEGESSFNYVISNPGFSGLIRRKYDRPHEEDTQISVRTRRLDNLLSELNIGKVSFMKVDVEGAEYLVFEGGQETIGRDQPIIVFEHGLGGSDCYGKRPEDVFDLLCERCGLRVSTLPRWLRGQAAFDRSAFCDQFYSGRDFYYIASR